MKSKDKAIHIVGARVHNLKNINVSIPYHQLVVVTGVSGSGKSSLTIDTLFAEGQRRYIESLSSYARQFMKSMQKPDVDRIDGLCPAIAIEQKVTARSPRSTVGSMTEIVDYLRLLYAKIGRTFSPLSGNEVIKHEVSDVTGFIKTLQPQTKVLVLIPLQASAEKNITYYLEDCLQKGYTRLYNIRDHQYYTIEDVLADKTIKVDFKTFYILIDRLVVKNFEQDEWHRISDSIQTAFDETHGDVYLEIDGSTLTHFCNRFELDGMRFEIPSPNFFSSNNPYGACDECEGMGMVLGIDPSLVIPNKSLSLYEGAVACWSGEKMSEWKHKFMKATGDSFPIHKPIHKLSVAELDVLWHHKYGIHAFFKMVESNTYKIQYRVLLARYRGRTKCGACEGSRIRKDALYVKINHTHIGTLLNMPMDDLYEWLKALSLTKHEKDISKRILLELNIRIQTMLDVGLHYLTLNRTANTLSGGESQRIQLTRVIGSNLSDSLYILDEPSIGLHGRDTSRLISVLQRLRDLGNTVVIVEHDDQIMKAADHIIDIGPLASHLGGEVVAEGNYKQMLKHKTSLTAKYLSGAMKVDVVHPNRKVVHKLIVVNGSQHNLKNITVAFPLNMLCVVSGVSGSGKTTLVKHLLHPAVLNAKGDFSVKPGEFGGLEGDIDRIESVEMVDQNPIGKSSRSNPVTYIKAYDEIRNFYANMKLSKLRGYTSGFFSFNVDGGRCDTCKGEGETTVEMQFLADVHLLCEECKGKRFKKDVLDVTYREKSIADILDLSVDQAVDFFSEQPKIQSKIKLLQDVGLGYIKLGQSANTLSGGEAQRVKLASFLDRSYHQKRILFIFDEPTTGLHFHDIQKLLTSFQALIEHGHSIIVIEHNPDVIRNADWVIDIGPEGGDGGGELVFQGTPQELKKSKKGYTALFV